MWTPPCWRWGVNKHRADTINIWQTSDEGAVMQKNVLRGSAGRSSRKHAGEVWARVQVRAVSRDQRDRRSWRLSAAWQTAPDRRHAAILTTLWPRSSPGWWPSATSGKHLFTGSWLTLVWRETWWEKYANMQFLLQKKCLLDTQLSSCVIHIYIYGWIYVW